MNFDILKSVSLLMTIVVLASCSGLQSPQVVKAEGPPPSIIPLPQSVAWKENMYIIPQENKICYNKAGETSAEWLHKLLEAANVKAESAVGEACGNWNIVVDPSPAERIRGRGLYA